MKLKNFKVSDTVISVLVGISLLLLVAVFMLSPGTKLNFLSIGVVATFGFVGYWALLPILAIEGIYIIFKKHFSKIKFHVSVWGLVVIFVGALVLLTNIGVEGYTIKLDDGTILKFAWNGEAVTSATDPNVLYNPYIEVKNAVEYLNKIVSSFGVGEQGIDPNATGWNYASLQYQVATGGGFVGYLLAGILNSLIKPIGANIVSIFIMVGGLLLVFHNEVKRFFTWLSKKTKHSKKSKVGSEEFDEISIDDSFADEDEDSSLHRLTDEEIEEIEKAEEPIENLEINDDHIDEDLQTLNMNAFNNMNRLHKPSAFGSGESALTDINNPVDDAFLTFNYSPFAKNIETEETYEQEPVNNEIEPEPLNEHSFDNIAPSFEQKSEEPISEPVFANEKTIDSQVFETNVPNSEEPIEEQVIEEQVEEIDMSKAPIETPIQPAPIQPEPKPEPKLETKPEPVDTYLGQPKAKPFVYNLPPLDLLKLREKEEDLVVNESSCQARTELLNQIFNDLNIGAKVVGHTIGPSVTRFNVQMESNRSVTNIDRFVQDIQVRMGGIPVRFEKVVLGSPYSGIEISNEIRTTVGLRECIEKMPPISLKTRYMIPFGKDINGNVISADVTKFPHMLIAGTTGSGKSIFVHSMLVSLLARNKPDELKLLLIDPKKVEMAKYKNLPHLLCPNVSEPRQAYVALKKLCDEMERRYSLFAEAGVSDLKDFNAIVEEKGYQKLPIIMVFIDEYADLSETCKEIRSPVVRIAQKARAAGIHLIIATQRPSVNVIDGVIQSNISTRVALSVSKTVDSTVIIGEAGAEKLLGYGDMLIDSPEVNKFIKPRVQGAFVESIEIVHFCDYIRSQLPPQYDPNFLNLEDDEEEDGFESADEPTKVDKNMADDELYSIVKEDIMKREYCSISYIQRNYSVGFPKAGKFMARLQKEGVVSTKQDSAKGSKVLMHTSEEQSEQMGSIEQSTLIPAKDE